MARNLKPQKVDTVYYNKAKLSCDILLNRNTLEFEAVFAGQTYTDKTANALKYKMLKVMEDSVKLEWLKLIEVHEEGPFMGGDGSAFVGLRSRRFVGARRPDGVLLQVSWDLPDHHPDELLDWAKPNFDWRDFDILPYTKSYRDTSRSYLILYSEEIWNGLQQMQEAIISIRERLQDILSSQEGHLFLHQLGKSALSLLPGGEGGTL